MEGRDDNSLASDVVASTASHAASPDCYTVLLPYRTDKRNGKVRSSLSYYNELDDSWIDYLS